MRPIEPLRYVARAFPVPLFFQSALHDELIPRADTLRYYRAASSPKRISWYDSGHFLPDRARCDAAVWLQREIRIAARALPACR